MGRRGLTPAPSFLGLLPLPSWVPFLKHITRRTRAPPTMHCPAPALHHPQTTASETPAVGAISDLPYR